VQEKIVIRLSAETLEVFAAAIGQNGWAVTRPIVDHSTVTTLRGAVDSLAAAGRGGVRNLLDIPEIQLLAASHPVRRLAASVLGAECFAVRALLFDKTPEANWKVIWHQDLTIAVKARAQVTGYGPWTEKAGVPHVQPPISVLERMLAVRIHLDACGSENGPVRVLDRSHRLGRLSGSSIDAVRARQVATDCVVDQGGVLAFRPLLLHASAPATVPDHRRVIHIEFAHGDLTPPLAWHRQVGAALHVAAR
jgi:ectoine hydroxylase-related dioxygenase (phytanoyl-CoA dioxygenase family)